MVRVLRIAHRTPATVAAIENLIAAGADMVEIDVQLDAGRLVASHYLRLGALPWLGIGPLLERDNGRIRRHRTPSPDPPLVEIAARVPTDIRVLLDPKESQPARRAELARLLIDLPDRSRFSVSSPFSDDLAVLRSAGFQTWRTVKNASALQQLLHESAFADAGISIRHGLISATNISALRRLTPTVVAWTVNDARTALQLRTLGVTGITTDRPDVLRLLRD